MQRATLWRVFNLKIKNKNGFSIIGPRMSFLTAFRVGWEGGTEREGEREKERKRKENKSWGVAYLEGMYLACVRSWV